MIQMVTPKNNVSPTSDFMNGNDVSACGICWQSYTKNKRAPVTLHCGHTFCQGCINEMGRGKTHLQCGICRIKTWYTPAKLSKNYQLVELLGKFGFLKEDDPIEEHKCGPAVDHSNVQQEINNQAIGVDGNAQNNRADQNPALAEEGNNQRREISDESAQVLNIMREAIGTLNDGFEDLGRIAVDYQDDFDEFYRQVKRVFRDIEGVAYHHFRDDLRQLWHQRNPNAARENRHRHNLEMIRRNPFLRGTFRLIVGDGGVARMVPFERGIEEPFLQRQPDGDNRDELLTAYSIDSHYDSLEDDDDEMSDADSLMTALEIGVPAEEHDLMVDDDFELDDSMDGDMEI